MLLIIRAEKVDNLRTITQKWNLETRQMAPFFSSPFSAITVCNIHFCIKTDFCLVPHLIHEILQFVAKSYRFRQLNIHFQKVDTLRLLKVHIIFCPTAGKYTFFKGPSSWTITVLLHNNFTCMVVDLIRRNKQVTEIICINVSLLY